MGMILDLNDVDVDEFYQMLKKENYKKLLADGEKLRALNRLRYEKIIYKLQEGRTDGWDENGICYFCRGAGCTKRIKEYEGSCPYSENISKYRIAYLRDFKWAMDDILDQ